MNYAPPFILFNAHLETIYPALMRRVRVQPYKRERITTPDEDFLDLDWLTGDSQKLVIISHGLEGNSKRAYVLGMARAFFQHGYDVLAWNFRGCSEELNRQLRFYHSGATDDLDIIVRHAVGTGRYDEINLIGFSLGGNLTLKYLGEERRRPQELNKAIAFSVPLDLHSSCIKISRPENWIYSQRFLRSLTRKVKNKAKVMREIDTRGLSKIKTLMEFDDHFTGPMHGFKNAIDYYEKSSAIRFIKHVTNPTLLINALNDPFLSEDCYPKEILKHHAYIRFEVPARGGHVGFTQFGKNGLYWSEQRAMAFLNND